MIAPRNRLLLWFGIVVLPLAVVGPSIPHMAIPAMATIAAFVLMAAFDALYSLSTPRGIAMELPEVTRMTNGREASIDMAITNNNTGVSRQFRVALPLSHEVNPIKESILVRTPADNNAIAHYQLMCMPIKRGGYAIEGFYAERDSALGLWALRYRVPLKAEARVYPGVLNEKRSVAAMLLNRPSGLNPQRQLGQGREFERLREYFPGDSFDSIHWKASARRTRPITKVYQIERAQDIYVIIDASRLSARPVDSGSIASTGQTEAGHDSVLERFLTAGLILGIAAERQGDMFGLITFSDRVHRFLRASNGRSHFNSCKEALYLLEPSTATPDYDELCSFISTRIRKRALLVFLTSLDDPVLAEGFTHNMDIIRKRHLPLAMMITPGAAAKPLFTEPAPMHMDGIYSALGGHLIWHDLQELDKTLRSKGVMFKATESAALSVELINMYASIKRRQAL